MMETSFMWSNRLSIRSNSLSLTLFLLGHSSRVTFLFSLLLIVSSHCLFSARNPLNDASSVDRLPFQCLPQQHTSDTRRVFLHRKCCKTRRIRGHWDQQSYRGWEWRALRMHISFLFLIRWFIWKQIEDIPSTRKEEEGWGLCLFVHILVTNKKIGWEEQGNSIRSNIIDVAEFLPEFLPSLFVRSTCFDKRQHQNTHQDQAVTNFVSTDHHYVLVIKMFITLELVKNGCLSNIFTVAVVTRKSLSSTKVLFVSLMFVLVIQRS